MCPEEPTDRPDLPSLAVSSDSPGVTGFAGETSRDQSTFARKGSWQRRKNQRAFAGDFITSRRKGSELVTRLPTTERIVLVIGTVKKGGKVRKGKLRIVVAKNRPVRIEGVAVVTDPPS